MDDNRYERWLGEDNDKCLPILDRAAIGEILNEVTVRVRMALGDGPRPIIALNLEHLQVADYADFDGVGEKRRLAIRRFHEQSPIRSDEMLFLGLRSLFQFAWPEPQNENDIRFAAAFDHVLNQILTQRALDLSRQFSSPHGLQPYWGRLAFLRSMVGMPIKNVARFGLDRVACALVKKSKFNATTWSFEDGPIITLNYALEPILKQLNRYLLHYHSTRDMAGPDRISRAWHGVVPIVLHFWSDVVATRLVKASAILYGEDTALMAHRLTADQVDFIVGHELGHVALDHPNRLKREISMGGDTTAVRHEFEFGADAFALGLVRSKLVNSFRERTHTDRQTEEEAQLRKDVLFALHDYQRGLGAAYILFIYMDFIQRAGELVRGKLSGRVSFAGRIDSHPRASERLERLELANMGENLYTSPLQRYARNFFQDILHHVSSLDDEALFASLGLSTANGSA